MTAAPASDLAMLPSTVPSDVAGQDTSSPPPRSVWLTTLDYAYGWNHGNHLRTFAIAREWVRRGAEVHFIALRLKGEEPARALAYLEQLQDEGVITGFDEIEHPHPKFRGKLARAALHPAARGALLAAERRSTIAELGRVARRVKPTLFVQSGRELLFATPFLRRHHAPVAIDWKDSLDLAGRRLVHAAVAQREWARATTASFETCEVRLEERYYARRADFNIMVSPVDAAALQKLAHPRTPVQTVPNGIRVQPELRGHDARTPGRLVFSGNMDFPPNHYSALWFIQHVLPRVVARSPTVKFVVAGSGPRPQLRALAGPNVEITGWVDDMHAELARSTLYVAPMTSGSGFKNKVIEALATGTNVVGTTYAFEFLPDELRSLFINADAPDQLAAAIVAALDDPDGNERTVKRFWQLARDEYNWEHVAARFARAVQIEPAAR